MLLIVIFAFSGAPLKTDSRETTFLAFCVQAPEKFSFSFPTKKTRCRAEQRLAGGVTNLFLELSVFGLVLSEGWSECKYQFTNIENSSNVDSTQHGCFF